MQFYRVRPVPIAALGLLAFAAIAQDSGRTVTPSDLMWKPSRTVPGLENVDLMGDISKPGPIVTRTKFPPNFTLQAHTHPDDRTYTIISGTWYVGWGTKFDETKLKALPAGSFYSEPANVPHFVATKGDGAEVQISGTAPVVPPQYVDPAHAPKK
jgi:quercetin dioxygenase-like cupin family protein